MYRHTSSVRIERNNIFEPYQGRARIEVHSNRATRELPQRSASRRASELTLGAAAYEGGGGLALSKAIIELAVLDVGRPALAAVRARAAAQRVLEELVPDVGHAGQAPMAAVAHARPQLPVPTRVRVRS